MANKIKKEVNEAVIASANAVKKKCKGYKKISRT